MNDEPYRKLSDQGRLELIKFARETWVNDGAEGETVHRLCDELGHAYEVRDRIAEHALFILNIYPGYKVESRGPTGQLHDILGEVRPDLLKRLQNGESPYEVHQSEFSEEETSPYLPG